MTDLIKKIILTAAVLFSGIAPVLAHKDTSFNSPHKLELKPASFAEPGYQLAKSYWLGGADIDLGFKGDDDATVCQSMGYFQKDCQDNKSPLQRCPYNQAYFKCSCDTSVYRYSTLNCPSDSSPDISEENSCENYSNSCVCEGGKIWVVENNSCVDCLNDTNCGDNQKCQNNECVNVNLCENVSCTGGQTCNDTTGACECPSGEVFYKNRCEVPSCANKEIQCSGTTDICNEATGKCVECLTASDCNANEICSANTCQTVDRCKDVSCASGSGKSCNPNNGQCECPSDKPYESSGVCEVPNCDNGGFLCGEGLTCNTTTKLCEEVKEETCRTQAEAKGWTLITNEAEFTEALKAEKVKFAFSGNVQTRSILLVLKADNAILADAAQVVGGLCTEPGSIDLKSLQTNATVDINVPGMIASLGAGLNSVININADNFVVDKAACTKNSTCKLNLKGWYIYLKEIESFSGSNLTVYGNSYDYMLYDSILNGSTLYPSNVDLVTIQSGSTVMLAGGMSVGTIEMSGVDQNIQTVLNFGDGSYIVSRPYQYQISHNFIDVSDCRNKGCIINVGSQTGGNVNINMNGRGINYEAASGYSYAGSGSLGFHVMSSVFKNAGTISGGNSSSRRYIVFFFDSKGNASAQFQFASGGFLGIGNTWGGSSNHFQCRYDFSGSISSASQCPTNTGDCTCSRY